VPTLELLARADQAAQDSHQLMRQSVELCRSLRAKLQTLQLLREQWRARQREGRCP
jgi:hypothetical protein